MKGQGALEYLIIVAAVLAIAAIVVMFLTGAFRGTQPSAVLSACRNAASQCANYLATTRTENCKGTQLGEECKKVCDPVLLKAPPYKSPEYACYVGDTNAILLRTTG